MSKRKIVVTIHANAKTCGRCREWDDSREECGIFHQRLNYDERCPACLAAEKAYKEATSGKA